jgi:hypothetical protein
MDGPFRYGGFELAATVVACPAGRVGSACKRRRAGSDARAAVALGPVGMVVPLEREFLKISTQVNRPPRGRKNK